MGGVVLNVFKTNHKVKSIAGNVHIMVVMICHVFAVAIAYPVITTTLGSDVQPRFPKIQRSIR